MDGMTLTEALPRGAAQWASSPKQPLFGQQAGPGGAHDDALSLKHLQPAGFYTKRIGHAYSYALKNHSGQVRKGSSVPYQSHLDGVKSLVMQYIPYAQAGIAPGQVPSPSAVFEQFDVTAPGSKFLSQSAWQTLKLSLSNQPLEALKLGIKRFRLGLPGHRNYYDEKNPNKINITLEDMVIAAVLHDFLEDVADRNPGKANDMLQKFGPVVYGLVRYATTEDDWTDPPEQWDYNGKKRAYLQAIAQGPQAAVIVSACDKLHNMRAMLEEYQRLGEPFWQRFGPTKSQKLQYNRDIVAILGASGKVPPDLLETLTTTQRQIEALAPLSL